jgi:hypothetical protein
VAALIKDQLNLETDLEPGGRGEFSVWVGDKKVAEKTRTGFPAEATVVELVRAATN